MEQLKESTSPHLTTPLDGATDRTGGGKVGVVRVGGSSGEIPKGRRRGDSYLNMFVALGRIMLVCHSC